MSQPIIGGINSQLDKKSIKKMLFIMHALDKGWSVKKIKESFIFTKKHENRREVFMENYLEQFILENMEDTHIMNF